MKTQELTRDLTQIQSKYISKQHSPIVLDKVELRRLKLDVLAKMYGILAKKTNPLKALKLIDQFRKKYQSIFGESLMSKVSKVENRYYWRLGSPGFPSEASFKMYKNEMKRLLPTESNFGMRTIFLAITKKCPLNCEHCFEWNNLNEKDSLRTKDIIKIVHKYQDFGTTQFMFSGGEPMLRVNDIYKVLNEAREGTDFWIITSGLGLNFESAKRLKNSGLTGVMVSLDHHEETKHNIFRGNENAYSWAIQAVINANRAGLVTALALCATKTYVTNENLSAYMNLAKELGVSFVQILEPRATGRYFGKDVMLEENEIRLLDKNYLEYNSSEKFKDYPIINYLGYHQRKVGCFGSGNRFFYIDTDGDAHICPYCEEKIDNTLQHSAKEIVGLLKDKSCHVYDKSGI
jgi:MoaA/NifB/PqqE/SkfB family radical SAM enzyme